MSKPLTYKDSGVDIEAGDRLVNSIKELVKETHTPSVLSNIGGFGGLFSASFPSMKEPVLVSSVDGVGTKLMVAFMMERYDTVGEDLVNHCVNDIAVCGATPLFFLDYFSTGRLRQEVAFDVIKGFTRGCSANGVALIGGETAEMPDMYKDGEFDLAGTIVGVVDRAELINGSGIKAGDVLIGIPSNGLHTNGYSLARKALLSTYDVHSKVDGLEGTLGEELLRVHTSYLGVIRSLRSAGVVKGLSHITGGGLVGNTNRILPSPERHLQIDWDAWEWPPLFRLIQETGHVPTDDMRRAFNLGIGLVAVVDPKDVESAMGTIHAAGFDPVVVGSVQ